MGSVKEKSCKLCRREKEKLFLKGSRCFTDKCEVERKPYMPGQRAKMRLIESEYYTQLREKQKAKRYYGILEKQFRNYYKQSVKRKGITGEILLELLETRLDNVVYLMGLAVSRRQARQLISHGHVYVNDKKVDVASYHLREGQTVSIAPSSKEILPVLEAKESASSLTPPEWLKVDLANLKGQILRMPERSEIKAPVNERMIIELYSKV
ncbi:MAG: 30S ribosomal protein S4 [Actinobacteria bacterium]|nr:30S ribosomal protein S4 [Actinomycetota bacterium]MBM3712725.1 30S ribosomal protein S4 [Actinomycetota bacterium]